METKYHFTAGCGRRYYFHYYLWQILIQHYFSHKIHILNSFSICMNNGFKTFLNLLFNFLHHCRTFTRYFQYRISANSFRTLVRKLFKFSLHKRKLNAETIWDFQGFKSSKTIVSVETVRGNTVFKKKYCSWNICSRWQ